MVTEPYHMIRMESVEMVEYLLRTQMARGCARGIPGVDADGVPFMAVLAAAEGEPLACSGADSTVPLWRMNLPCWAMVPPDLWAAWPGRG